jgi:NADPH:quinone reductase-like Zn-dependent oxidoreductase
VKPEFPFGGMAEKTLVETENCIPLPDEVDDVTAAAIANPGMSSMAALKSRAALKAGETVLVNGATGAAGKLAVQIAKHLGAKKIIATGRDSATLEKLKGLGVDVTINLTLDPKLLEEAFAQQISGGGIDVVLDYLYGKSAELLLTTLARNSEGSSLIRYVNIGSGTAPEINLPAAALRAIPISLMGSGLGSVPFPDLLAAIRDVMKIVVPGKLEIEMTVVPLAEVEKTWNGDFGKSRVVFGVK